MAGTGQGDLHLTPVESQTSFLIQMYFGKIRSVLYWDRHLKTEELYLSLHTMPCLFQYGGSDPASLPEIKIVHVPLLSTIPGYIQFLCKNSCLLHLSLRLV